MVMQLNSTLGPTNRGIILSGYLERKKNNKASMFVSAYVKRFYTLTATELVCFESEEYSVPKMHFSLIDIVSIEPCELKSNKVTDFLIIMHDSTSHKLRAASVEGMRRWISCLSEARNAAMSQQSNNINRNINPTQSPMVINQNIIGRNQNQEVSLRGLPSLTLLDNAKAPRPVAVEPVFEASPSLNLLEARIAARKAQGPKQPGPAVERPPYYRSSSQSPDKMSFQSPGRGMEEQVGLQHFNIGMGIESRCAIVEDTDCRDKHGVMLANLATKGSDALKITTGAAKETHLEKSGKPIVIKTSPPQIDTQCNWDCTAIESASIPPGVRLEDRGMKLQTNTRKEEPEEWGDSDEDATTDSSDGSPIPTQKERGAAIPAVTLVVESTAESTRVPSTRAEEGASKLSSEESWDDDDDDGVPEPVNLKMNHAKTEVSLPTVPTSPSMDDWDESEVGDSPMRVINPLTAREHSPPQGASKDDSDWDSDFESPLPSPMKRNKPVNVLTTAQADRKEHVAIGTVAEEEDDDDWDSPAQVEHHTNDRIDKEDNEDDWDSPEPLQYHK